MQNVKKIKTLLIIVAFLSGFVCLFLYFSPLLTEKIISVYLHKQGLKDFQFKVDKVSINELSLSSFKIGKEKEIKLSEAKFLYSLKGVLAGKVNSIEISGLSVDLQGANGKLSSDVMRHMPQRETKKTGYPPLILPFNKLVIQSSSINAYISNEKITATLSGNIDNSGGNNFIKSDLEIKITDQNRTLAATAFVEGSPSSLKGSFNLTAEGAMYASEFVDIPRGAVSLKSDISFLEYLLKVEVKELNVSIDHGIKEKKYNTSIEPFQLRLKENTKTEFQVDFSNSETPDFSYTLQLEPTVLKTTVRDKYERMIPLNIDLREAQFNGSSKAVDYKLKVSLEDTPVDEIILSLVGTMDNSKEARAIKSDFNVNFKNKNVNVTGTGDFDWSPSILLGHIDLSAEGEIDLPETINIPVGVVNLKSDFSFQDDLLNLQIKDATLKTDKTSDVKKFNARVEPFLIAQKRDKPVKLLADFRKNRMLISDEIELAPSKIKAIVKDNKKKDVSLLLNFQKANLSGELSFPEGKPLDYKIFAALKRSGFSIPEFKISAEETGIKAEISSQDASNKIKISLSDALIKHDRDSPYLAPLFMNGELNYLNGLSEFDGTLEGFDKKLVLDFSGTYKTQTDKGTARFKLSPVLFSKNSISPADIFPVSGKIIKDARGEVAVDGELSWSGKEIEPAISVNIKDLSFTLSEANFAGINGTIKFDGIAPLSTPRIQTLTISKVEAGLPLKNGKIDFNVKSEKIFMETIKWDLAGGTLYANPFYLKLADPKINKLVLNISKVQLNDLLLLVNRKDFSGTGVLNGTIPVEFFDDASFLISDGFLEASPEGGVLRYSPVAASSLFSRDNQNVKILINALDDFHYKKLKLTLNGGTKKGLETLLALYGSNPALYDGRAVELNVKLTGAIIEVLESALGIYKIPGQLQERLLK